MAHEPTGTTLSRFLIVVLVAILVSGGIVAACTKQQTTTSAPGTTTSSTTARTTTSATATALSTTTASAPTTSSAPAPTGVSAADFYKANLVTIVVPSAAGGGVDYAARLIANYWPEVTGGRMVVENKPGGGGITGTNYAYAAKPDGLTMAVGIQDAYLILPTLAADPFVKFDLKKMHWLVYTNGGEADGLAVGAKSSYNSIEEFSKGVGMKFASGGPSSTNSLCAGLLIEMFGLKNARITVGYGGATECMLAVAKGEADAFTISGAVLQDGVNKGFVKKSILTIDYERTSYFPDARAIPEVLKLSAEQDKLLRTYNSLRGGQAFWLQPGVPQDRIDYVRNAFDKIVALESFTKQSATRWQYVKPVSGKDYAAQMAKTLAVATSESLSSLQKIADKYQ